MATTTNFGWETPDDTDLVKDGALAMRTLGNSIDTSFVDLKGGTTGQVLSKASNTDLDFTWVAQDDSNAIQNAIVDAKGDLISATAADTPARLAVGTNGQVLTADSSTATGLKWAAASSGALTKITANTFSNAATVDIVDCFSSSYLYYLVMVDVSASTFGGSFNMQYLYSGSTVQNTGYYGSSFYYDRDNSLTTAGSKNVSSLKLLAYTGNTLSISALSFMITNVGNASEQPTYWGSGSSWGNSVNLFAGGDTGTARTYTGLRFFDTSYNITGNYKVYGVQN